MANSPPSSPQFPRGDYYSAQPYGGLQAQSNPYSAPQPYGGLQSVYSPQAAPMLPQPVVHSDQPVYIPPQDKCTAYAFIILAVIIIVLSAIDLELHYWIFLCGADISLTDVYFSNYNGSINHTKNLFCSGLLYTEEECDGSMCSHLKDLQAAGQITQGMGITATVCTGICLILMLLLLLRPTTHRLKLVFMRIAIVVPAVVWAIGAVVYLGYFVYVASSASNSTIGFGLVLAIAIIGVQVVNCVLGNKAVTKLTQ